MRHDDRWSSEGAVVFGSRGEVLAIAASPRVARTIVSARDAALVSARKRPDVLASAATFYDRGVSLDELRSALFEIALERNETIRSAAEAVGVSERTLHRYREAART